MSSKQTLAKPFQVIRANIRPYLLINVMAYGLMILGFGLGLMFPSLSQAQHASLEDGGTVDLVQSLLKTPWLFAIAIFAVNVLRLSLVTIVLPSMIVPFAGIALFAHWSFIMGLTFVPSTGLGWVALIPHSLTIVIEFQAYLLFALGAFLIGKYWLRPRSIGARNRRQGYRRGLQQLGWLSLPALALLVVGAIYEAFSLAYLVPPMAEWLL